ncbi:hypothetical protein, partial [Shigella sp. FC3196]|uniref:hypothetical protein n=1 Tax=Shigella sp. FC3196 TaxID=1898678 RepID=UPI001C0A6C9D
RAAGDFRIPFVINTLQIQKTSFCSGIHKVTEYSRSVQRAISGYPSSSTRYKSRRPAFVPASTK